MPNVSSQLTNSSCSPVLCCNFLKQILKCPFTLQAMIALSVVQSSDIDLNSQCNFVGRYLNNAWHNNANYLLGTPCLTIIVSIVVCTTDFSFNSSNGTWDLILLRGTIWVLRWGECPWPQGFIWIWDKLPGKTSKSLSVSWYGSYFASNKKWTLP